MTYKVIFRDSNQEDILVEADDLFLRDDHYVFVYTPVGGGEFTTAGMIPLDQVMCIIPVKPPEAPF